MSSISATAPGRTSARQLLNKVPEVTLWFWIIKCLCTTIGETLSDNFVSKWSHNAPQDTVAAAHTCQMALLKVTGVTWGVLAILLIIQMTRKKYIAPIYWATIVVISLAGTQVTDLFEGFGPTAPHDLWGITIVSLTLLAIVFAVWFYVERTLSMHSIRTWRREAFYWLAICVTFASGTGVGDLVSEKLQIDGIWGPLVFLVIIGGIFAAWKANKLTRLNGTLAFWLAYILTRPLGANLGDFMSGPKPAGLNLGTSVTSYIFLGIIILAVVWLTIRKPDVTPPELVMADAENHPHMPHPHLLADHPEAAHQES
ncbi:MAG: hypothetical protein J2O48_03705 [Solirubrobacterales bacterium]|nr:hypothetical protein [Solirubrobacterales bacterium]